MKRFLCILICSCVSVATITVAPAVLLMSCANSSASYKTLASTQAATTAALNAFGEARAKGKVSDADYATVDAAYKQYQAAFETAVAAARLNLNTATPPEVAQLAATLAQVIESAIGGAK